MSKLVVVVPNGRAFCGRAYVVGADGITRAGPFRALATASGRVGQKHGNPACSVLYPFGHPATGTYVIASSLPPGFVHTKRARRFGRVGGLLLSPTSGDALRATSNGRKLTAIHGGPRDAKGRLRPTRGGVRLSNTHMTKLLAVINDAQRDGDPVSSIEIIEIDMTQLRKRNRRGGRKVAPRDHARAQKSDAPVGSGVSTMVLLPFVLGGAGKSPVKRRELLQAAAVAFGALAIQACDRPSRCSPLACYPEEDDAGDGGDDGGDAGHRGKGDAGCTTEGYVCDPQGGVG
jgi:hypothetical protein